MNTFKRPLIGKRKDTPAPYHTFDHAAIGKILRERLGGNLPGIMPDKPIQKCNWCPWRHDPNTNTTEGACNGTCGVY